MCAEAPSVPPSGPPSFAGLVEFELTTQELRNQDLVDGPLDENYDKAKDDTQIIPEFQNH